MSRDRWTAGLSGLRRVAAAPAALAAILTLSPAPAPALVPEFGVSATATGERREDVASYRLPTGPWTAGTIPARIAEGAVIQTAWQLDAPGKSTLELMIPLRAQVQAAGFRTIFECETMACGGFDFRYGTENLPEPGMHVDLGDFRFLSAERAGAQGVEVLSLLVSRSATRGFVQLTLVGPEMLAPPALAAAPEPVPLPDPLPPAAEGSAVAVAGGSLMARALDAGRAVALEGLDFAPGKADLAAGGEAMLAELAAWLAADPGRSVALVGHTDSSGVPEANLALSRSRAEAVRRVLTERYGADPARITARGAGAENPRADNATAEGRAQNRRVEVDPTPTP